MTPNEIIELVARVHSVDILEMRSRRKHARTVAARQAAMVYLRQYKGLSYPKIGIIFERDHTTAMHAVSAHRKRVAKHPASKGLDVLVRQEIRAQERYDISRDAALSMGI